MSPAKAACRHPRKGGDLAFVDHVAINGFNKKDFFTKKSHLDSFALLEWTPITHIL